MGFLGFGNKNKLTVFNSKKLRNEKVTKEVKETNS